MQSATNQRVIVYLKRLIWVYFFLLIFEGVFRKWLLPQYSDILLVIRDPVVLLIYALAIKAKIFPRNGFILALGVIAVLSWLVALVVLEPYLSLRPLILVTGFGFRSNFLHLPLIFVIGRAFEVDDVKALGRWTLIGLIPMSVLLAIQFNSAPDAFINRTAGLGETLQITAGGGKIRPPGTFSFVSGVIFYAAMSASFLLYGALTRGVYRTWLLFSAGLALALTIGVSGSRSVLLAVLVVVASLLVIIVVRPGAVNQFGRNLLIVVVVGLIVVRLPIFNEGVQILADRFTAAGDAEEGTIARGLIARMLSGFTEGFLLLGRAPIGGYGLGIGTNGGAKFLTGRTIFLLTEGEWGRVVLESGPILGLGFLAWRTLLTIKLALFSYRQLKGGDILPLMLYCAGFIALLNGQFGQPTNLGFAVFLSGLCLAAANISSGRAVLDPQPGVLKPTARRSRYAEQIHSSVARRHPDEFADR
ncbi:MAG TPA: hypothetical protein VM940_02940 [Chthoniobacterales bacterium]|jgi:hypothetical protein|nr:hypothetical protein [Chthoniobacterales bacterium]